LLAVVTLVTMHTATTAIRFVMSFLLSIEEPNNRIQGDSLPLAPDAGRWPSVVS
jgi:hypothetical protein